MVCFLCWKYVLCFPVFLIKCPNLFVKLRVAFLIPLQGPVQTTPPVSFKAFRCISRRSCHAADFRLSVLEEYFSSAAFMMVTGLQLTWNSSLSLTCTCSNPSRGSRHLSHGVTQGLLCRVGTGTFCYCYTEQLQIRWKLLWKKKKVF